MGGGELCARDEAVDGEAVDAVDLGASKVL